MKAKLCSVSRWSSTIRTRRAPPRAPACVCAKSRLRPYEVLHLKFCPVARILAAASTCTSRCRRESGVVRALQKEHALAGALGVEGAVGLVGLLEPPAMTEDALEPNLPLGNEAGAFEHAHRTEGPGADQGDLPAQQVGAHIQRHVAAFAYVAGGAPGAHALHGRL